MNHPLEHLMFDHFCTNGAPARTPGSRFLRLKIEETLAKKTRTPPLNSVSLAHFAADSLALPRANPLTPARRGAAVAACRGPQEVFENASNTLN